MRRLLDRGLAYLDSDSLTKPAGANAFEDFQAVLHLDPGNRDATASLARIADRYEVLARTELRRGNLKGAGDYVKKVAWSRRVTRA